MRTTTKNTKASKTSQPAKTAKATPADKTTKAKKAPAKPKAQDATALLRADHKLVAGLFSDYEKATSTSKKKALVTQICDELSVHAQIEEEIFYPAFKKALKDTELVPEATVEHATLTYLIEQIKDVKPDGDLFDAKVKVLSEYVKHHVKEEQNEMFPKAKASKLDLKELGAQLAKRKAQLMAARN